MKLISAQPNKSYKIVALCGDDGGQRRLLDMGFTSGSVIFVLGVAPYGGTILISLRGSNIALRESAAKNIMVEPINEL